MAMATLEVESIEFDFDAVDRLLIFSTPHMHGLLGGGTQLYGTQEPRIHHVNRVQVRHVEYLEGTQVLGEPLRLGGAFLELEFRCCPRAEHGRGRARVAQEGVPAAQCGHTRWSARELDRWSASRLCVLQW
eukprot:1772636-Pleurochrysis_carterae.AAC.1